MMTQPPILRKIFPAGWAALALTAAVPVQGDVFIQELFDAIAGPPPGTNASLNGKGDTATSIGLSGTWLTNVSDRIFTASNFNVDGGLPGLPFQESQAGGVWNATGAYNVEIFATRPLATPISFTQDRVIYFSFRANNSGDTAMGIGLAAGAGPGSEFIGSGLSWNNARALATGLNDSGNAAHVSYGFLTTTENGPYGIRNHEPSGSVNGIALIAGRLTIRADGNETIEIKRYAPGQLVDGDPEAVAWSVVDSYAAQMTEATHLLLWMNGVSGTLAGELDAIRMGDTWEEVVGTPPSDPYYFWAADPANALIGSNAQPGADPDKDGIPNGVEFVIGGNPNASTDFALLPTMADEGFEVRYVFRRAAQANVDPLPYVQYSEDLGTWNDAENGANGVTIYEYPDGFGTGVDRIEVLVPKSLFSGDKCFLRLHAGR